MFETKDTYNRFTKREEKKFHVCMDGDERRKNHNKENSREKQPGGLVTLLRKTSAKRWKRQTKRVRFR
jgi:hypothetical protein